MAIVKADGWNGIRISRKRVKVNRYKTLTIRFVQTCYALSGAKFWSLIHGIIRGISGESNRF